jgi:hypothetical protein
MTATTAHRPAAAAVGLVVLAAAPFVRFRGADYRQRQQLKWVAFIALLSMLSVFAGIGLSRLLPAAGVLGALGVLGIAVGIPVAVAVAILRHRLYDIDRLINRTLVYGLLTAILGLSYAGVVLVLGELFGGVAAEPPSWAVAGATLAVAALFQPARHRIQAAVDRRFNRRKYNAATTIETFSARLRDQLDLDTLAGELLAVTDRTMQPTTVSLWLRPPTKSPDPMCRVGTIDQHRTRRQCAYGAPVLPNPGTGSAGRTRQGPMPAVTPCMPCSFGPLPHPRSERSILVDSPYGVTVTIRYVPLVTAAYGTWMARPARTTVIRR